MGRPACPARPTPPQRSTAWTDFCPLRWNRPGKGTLLAIRTAGFCKAASQAGALYLVENPAERDGHPSIFRIEDLEKALLADGFRRTRLRQCRYGADAAKRTDFVGNFEFAALDQCDHPSVWWRSPPSRTWPDGKRFQAPHAPLLGKKRAILDTEWVPHAGPQQWGDGREFCTQAKKAYPLLLNRRLARAFLEQYAVKERDARICRQPASPQPDHSSAGPPSPQLEVRLMAAFRRAMRLERARWCPVWLLAGLSEPFLESFIYI